MKYIVFSNGGQDMEWEDETFKSIDSFKDSVKNSGHTIKDVIPIWEFCQEWNNTDDDDDGYRDVLTSTFISYINIIEN